MRQATSSEMQGGPSSARSERCSRDPEFWAWADAKYLERWGVPQPLPEAQKEAGE
jgi:hypothetical protein